MSISEVDRQERMEALILEYRERRAGERAESLRRVQVRKFKYQGFGKEGK
jgi:hypothetical protein